MRKHNFIDKHPILGAILFGFMMMAMREMIAFVLAIIHSLVLGTLSDMFNLIYVIISSAIVFLFYKWWFSKEFEGALSGGNILQGLINCWPFIIYWIITAIVLMIDGIFELKPLSMATIYASVTAGIAEELVFRHGMGSTMMRNLNRKDQIVKICLISSIVFGLFHLLNLAQGADLVSTLIQAVTASSLGVFFCAIYYSSGNLLPGIILHAVHDIYAISVTSTVSENGIVMGGHVLSDIVDVICCLVLAAYAIYRLLGSDKLDKIVSLWDHKWGKDRIEPVEKEA